MAPLIPHWVQPSHPRIQQVILNPAAFTTKSISTVTVAPFGVFAPLSYPPCTPATTPTYATVQTGRNTHLNLNSDLVYINHSCSPSLIFDIPGNAVVAGPNGLAPGDELTFFYPSTEWEMAQGFDCFCGSETCRGRIEGAGKMSVAQLEGLWLNGWIRDMVAEREAGKNGKKINGVRGHTDIEEGTKLNGANGVRGGPTSRELSGEMGGDTQAA